MQTHDRFALCVRISAQDCLRRRGKTNGEVRPYDSTNKRNEQIRPGLIRFILPTRVLLHRDRHLLAVCVIPRRVVGAHEDDVLTLLRRRDLPTR